MLTWNPKDPDATLDYRWQPPLDDGDKLSAGSVTLVSGDVQIQSQAFDDTGVTVVLTGGTVGANLFHGTWASIGGRSDDEDISLEVAQKASSVDPLTAKLRRRYPAFAQVGADDIAYWLEDAERYVGAWGDDREVGILSAAARNMVLARVAGIVSTDVSGLGGTGVTSFRSGSFSASVTDDAANGKLTGLWDDDWARLIRVYGVGLGVASAGIVSTGWGYRCGLLDHLQ